MKAASPPQARHDFETGHRWLYEHSPVGVLVCDLQEQILQHNPAFARLVGCQQSDLVGQTVSQLLGPSDAQHWVEQLRLLGRGELSDFEFECRCRHKDGSSLWVQFWTSLMPEGKACAPKKIVSLVRSIERRKLAEAELRATSGRLEQQGAMLAALGINPVLRGNDQAAAFRMITEVAAQTLGVDRASIWFFDHDRKLMRCDELYESSLGAHSQGVELRMVDYPNYFAALADGRILPAHDAQADARTREFTEGYLKPLGITSLLDAPIRTAKGFVGVICNEHMGLPRQWTIDEQAFAASIADLIAISIEASERHQAEAALAEREERFRMLVEATSNLRFFITNPERTRWFYISPAMRRFWGMAEEGALDELQVTSIDREAVVPEDRTAYLERAQREIEGKTVDLTYRLMHSRLGERWTRTRTRGVRQADGSTRVYGVSEDITETKRYEAALTEREERFRMLVEFSSGMNYFITNPERSTWFYMSETSSAFLGLDPDQLGSDKQLQHHLIQRVLPEDRPIFLGRADRERGGELVDITYRVNHPSLGLRWVRTRTRGVTQADGSVRVYGVSEDITDSRRIQEALQRGEEQFRTIVESAPNGIVLVDKKGIISQVNAQLERDTGYRRNELLGQPVEILVPAKVAGGHPAHRQNYLKSPQDRPMGMGRELHVRHKNGSEFPAEIALSRVTTSEGNMIMATVVDVSARKLTERSLQDTLDRLRASNSELEQFAYAASHDLQEPLRAISGCLQIIERRYREKLDAEADELIGHVVQGAARMKGLIDDMLSFSRVAHNEVQFLPTDMEKILSFVLLNLKAAIAESGAEITHEALPVLKADPTQMTLLLQNLIANAIKFRGNAKPKIHLSAQRQRDGWKIGVHDNGIGIAPEFAERIFGMFKRLHTREAYPGSGIGLAICKKIAERHGGRLWVESVPKQGSSFFFALPDELSGDLHG